MLNRICVEIRLISTNYRNFLRRKLHCFTIGITSSLVVHPLFLQTGSYKPAGIRKKKIGQLKHALKEKDKQI